MYPYLILKNFVILPYPYRTVSMIYIPYPCFINQWSKVQKRVAKHIRGTGDTK